MKKTNEESAAEITETAMDLAVFLADRNMNKVRDAVTALSATIGLYISSLPESDRDRYLKLVSRAVATGIRWGDAEDFPKADGMDGSLH